MVDLSLLMDHLCPLEAAVHQAAAGQLQNLASDHSLAAVFGEIGAA